MWGSKQVTRGQNYLALHIVKCQIEFGYVFPKEEAGKPLIVILKTSSLSLEGVAIGGILFGFLCIRCIMDLHPSRCAICAVMQSKKTCLIWLPSNEPRHVAGFLANYGCGAS